jgi:hypothetical protein
LVRSASETGEVWNSILISGVFDDAVISGHLHSLFDFGGDTTAVACALQRPISPAFALKDPKIVTVANK